MKTVSESFAEYHQTQSSLGSTGAPSTGGPLPGVHRSSSTGSDDSSSDLMEHFMSELDLVFSDILAEEVSRRHLLSILRNSVDL